MGGVFNLLEKLNMKFPNGRSGLDDKIQFNEKVSFKLSSSDGSVLRGK